MRRGRCANGDRRAADDRLDLEVIAGVTDVLLQVYAFGQRDSTWVPVVVDRSTSPTVPAPPIEGTGEYSMKSDEVTQVGWRRPRSRPPRSSG
jgi:hypothetical protein